MKVTVWDTYVTKRDGTKMHFDILVPVKIKDSAFVFNYGNQYLKMKGQEGQPLTSNQCKYCHVEEVKPEWESDIIEKGYYIIEMENCEDITVL